MNIVVIGCGHWGKNHVRVLDELGHLYGVCDCSKVQLDQITLTYRCMDYQDVFKDPKVDAVVIATPPDTHYRITMDALEAGKHALVEKPMALDTMAASNMIRSAELNKKVLMVGHILEYHPAIQALKRYVMMDSGLGDIRYIYSNRLNIGRVRRGEDVLQSFAPHDIGLITSMLGVSPTSVEVKETSYLTEGVSDVTVMHLDFAQIGVKAHIFVSWVHPVKEQRLVVIGEKGMAVFDDQSNEKVRIYKHQVEFKEGESTAYIKKAEYELLDGAFKMAEPLKNELKHFVFCCEKGTSPHTNGNYGYEVVDVLERAQQKVIRFKEKKVFGKFEPSEEVAGRASCGNLVFEDTDGLNNEEDVVFGRVKVFEAGLHRNSLWKLAGIFVHKSSFIDEDVEIGEGTKIWHFSHIQKGAKIGENCVIGQNVNIGPGVVIGDNVKIQNNVSVYEGVIVCDGAFIGPSVVFTNVRNPEDFGKSDFKITTVGNGVVIGANATIVCGIGIGNNAFIGAGSVVTKDVKANCITFGNPSRQRGYR